MSFNGMQTNIVEGHVDSPIGSYMERKRVKLTASDFHVLHILNL